MLAEREDGLQACLPFEVHMGRGFDDAVVKTVAEPHRARQRDGHIGPALNQHYVGGLLGLSRTEACTQGTLDEVACARRATIRANLKPLLCGRRHLRKTG